jgi:multicomponent K+:H+ antiporter subunit A
MVNTNSLIFFPLIALLAGVVLELILGRTLSRTAKGWLAFFSGLFAVIGNLFLLPMVIRDGSLSVSLLQWDRGIDLSFRVDGLSMVFSLMATVIGTAILLYCIAYMAHEPEGVTRFYVFMLTFIAGLVSLVQSSNLLVAYVSWEIIGLCSYFLVGFWYKQPAASQGARKVLVMTHLAGYGFLIAILILFVRSGTFDWTNPALQAAFSTGPFLLLLLAAMAKSVMFPLHTWIPEAMNAPTPVSALLHSACYVKAGVYLIARLYSISPWQPEWNTLVMVIGAITMIVGALFALAQTDLKRLLAFSTISQLGHIITAFGIGTPLGILTGVFYTLSHGLFKGTLFLCAGAVQHETGTRDMRLLGGLAARMPVTTALWLIAAASIVGVPLGNGFVAKWLLIDSALDSGQMLLVLITWLVSIFTAFYMLKATSSVFFGSMPQELADKPVHEAVLSMRIGMGVLAGMCVLFGIAPQLLVQTVVVPAVNSMGFQSPVQLSWFGLQTTSAGMSVTFGGLVVLFALVVAGLVFIVRRPRAVEVVGVFTGGDPLQFAGETMGAGDFADSLENSLVPIYRVTDPDKMYLGIWKAIGSLAAWLEKAIGLKVESKPVLATILVSIVLGILVWVL